MNKKRKILPVSLSTPGVTYKNKSPFWKMKKYLCMTQTPLVGLKFGVECIKSFMRWPDVPERSKNNDGLGPAPGVAGTRRHGVGTRVATWRLGVSEMPLLVQLFGCPGWLK